MKRIKNDWRNRLGNETLNMLMRIILSCKDVRGFDPTDAIELWHSDSTRGRLFDTRDVEELTLSDLDTSIEEL